MTDEDRHDTARVRASDAPDGTRSRRPVLEVDVERYQHLLDDPALTAAQKEQIIEALWSIIVSFVELGFGVHPLPTACGQVPEAPNKSTAGPDDRLYLADHHTTEFEQTEEEPLVPVKE